MDADIVILAAGRGTRMGSSSLPKVLVELSGKPLVSYLLENLKSLAAEKPPIVVVGFMRELVQATLGNKFRYATQEQQLGTAHAVAAARPAVSAEHVVVLYGDMPFIIEATVRRLLVAHGESGGNFTMLTASPPNFQTAFQSLGSYGRIIRSASGELERIVEYKDAGEHERALLEVNPGIYCFRAAWLWRHIDKVKNENVQGEFYLTDLLEIAVREGERVRTEPVSPIEVVGINTPEQLQAAEEILAVTESA